MTSTASDCAQPIVEVRYAWPDRSWQASVVLDRAMSIADVLAQAGFHQAHPGWDAVQAGVGINGRLASQDTAVQAGDRIEIYRPLSFDPMVSRRRRAQHKARQDKQKKETTHE